MAIQAGPNLSRIHVDGSEIFRSGQQGIPGPSEVFEGAITGDFNADGYVDLAAGVGDGITLIYGAIGGLGPQGSQHLGKISLGAASGITIGRLGIDMAVGDFNDDGYDDLAAGAPLSNVDSKLFAGAVVVLFGGSSGLSVQDREILTQNTAGVEGAPVEITTLAQPWPRGTLTAMAMMT